MRQVDPVRQRRFIPAGAGNTLGLGLGLGSDAVYPRWRGEHTSFSLNDNPQRGLSPLARGTRGDRSYDPAWLRFIPAGAGNTWLQTNQPASGSVYPRWRGEHQHEKLFTVVAHGLSPLARGTL